MRFRYNETCYVCHKVFCCSSCRDKHVIRKQHYKKQKERPALIETNNKQEALECPLCAQQPLALQRTFNARILQHIENEHLPLHCRNCAQVYNNIADLKHFTKCSLNQSACNVTDENIAQISEIPSSIAIAVTQNSISTQTSPATAVSFVAHTPVSLTQEYWKSCHKVIKDDYISDSVSSIKNWSAMSNVSMRRSVGIITTTATSNKGKLVRTTSTPVQAELLKAKLKEQTFDASSGQVSSIYNSEIEPGPDRTPAVSHVNGSLSSPKQTVDNLYKYRKISARSRVAAVTPLRQVMSKSIQKAFAEHGALPCGTGRVLINDRQKIIHTFDSDSGSHIVNSMSSPLDLRISPVVRRSRQLRAIDQRSQNVPINMKMENKLHNQEIRNQEILLSSQKLTTESIVITHTKHVASSTRNGYDKIQTTQDLAGSSSAVYTTCQSVKIITATELSAYKAPSNEAHQIIGNVKSLDHDMTPISREQVPILQKKIINFESPKISITDVAEIKPLDVSVMEKFFTPESTPISQSHSPVETAVQSRKKLLVRRKLCGTFTPRQRPPIRECIGSNNFKRVEYIDAAEDKVFVTKSAQHMENIKELNTGWSIGNIMSSVKSSVRQCFNADFDSNKFKNIPLLKRCASFAGNLVRTHSLQSTDELRNCKRKRTCTIGEHQSGFLSPLNSTTFGSPENLSISKRFRIQPRKPIHFSSPQ